MVARRDLRVEDVVGRWGGEEFIVTLYDCRRDTAIERLDPFQRALARYSLTRATGRIFHIAFSAGVAESGRGDDLRRPA